MKIKEYTVVDAVEDVLVLNRAGRNATQTSVATLAKITPPRAKRILSSALKHGMLYAYSETYRSNVKSVCYALTETGRIVQDTIAEHKKTTIWRLSDD